jgi:hypothetical protein
VRFLFGHVAGKIERGTWNPWASSRETSIMKRRAIARLLGCLIFLFGPVLIVGLVFTETLAEAADELARLGLHTPLTDETALLAVVQVVGVVGRDGQWRVMLKEHSTGETHFLREGQTAFGYQVKGITWDSVVLEAQGQAFTLRVGQYGSAAGPFQLSHLPAVGEDLVNSSIPDLTHMGNAERQLWITQWREALSALPPEDQMAAREQVRNYWREQWEGQWGHVLRSTMTFKEQESVRREIRSYWR